MRNSLIDGEPKIEMDDTTNLSKYYKKPSNTIPAETTTIETMSFFFFFFFNPTGLSEPFSNVRINSVSSKLNTRNSYANDSRVPDHLQNDLLEISTLLG